MVPVHRAPPATDAELPNLENERKETEEPRLRKSKAEQREPKREAVRTDKTEPKLANWSTEKRPALQLRPETLKPDPILLKLLMLIEDPMAT